MDNTLLCVSLERFLERDLLNLLSLFLAGPMRGYAEMPRWEGQSQSCSPPSKCHGCSWLVLRQQRKVLVLHVADDKGDGMSLCGHADESSISRGWGRVRLLWAAGTGVGRARRRGSWRSCPARSTALACTF